jgi:hypothetical protein
MRSGTMVLGWQLRRPCRRPSEADGDNSMQTSAEIRWFWAAGRDQAVDATINGIAQALRLSDQTPAARQDRYLVFPSPSLGVKRREGRLEIKQRLTARVDLDAQGRVEDWIKWSHEGPEHLLEDITRNGRWVTIEKHRRTLNFRPLSAERVTRVDEGSIEHGCQVELTEIVLDHRADTRTWTLGLEAFNDPTAQLRWLTAALGVIAPALASWPRKLVDSCSYPEWILRHLR